MVNTMQDFTYITGGEYLKAQEHLRNLLNTYFLVDKPPTVPEVEKFLSKIFPFLSDREKCQAHIWYQGFADSIKRCASTTGISNLADHWATYSSDQNPIIIALHKLQDDYTHHQIEVARAHITHQ